ncbi:arsenate reductase (glutaredoxin) [Zavarzinia sp. CC-PAN008]|uniref:arsenate reductase (glutaredoxin) n=1 Tax=Zavarzinia sp. CC-PAN008 TaxID=3243332 RepID=UPI003F7483A8
MSVTIFHNPACGTSRKVLARLTDLGLQPRIIEYLKTPPSAAELARLLTAMGWTPRQLLRRRGTPYDDLGLDDPRLSDAALIAAMVAHPILIERPIVETPKGVRLARPPEELEAIL